MSFLMDSTDGCCRRAEELKLRPDLCCSPDVVDEDVSGGSACGVLIKPAPNATAFLQTAAQRGSPGELTRPDLAAHHDALSSIREMYQLTAASTDVTVIHRSDQRVFCAE